MGNSNPQTKIPDLMGLMSYSTWENGDTEYNADIKMIVKGKSSKYFLLLCPFCEIPLGLKTTHVVPNSNVRRQILSNINKLNILFNVIFKRNKSMVERWCVWVCNFKVNDQVRPCWEDNIHVNIWRMTDNQSV